MVTAKKSELKQSPIDTDQELLNKAKTVLADNFNGLYTRPGHGLYPHQVLWDSCFVAIGESNYDIERAKDELKSLIRGQWKNGMAPTIIFNEDPKYWLDRIVWRSHINPDAPKIPTAGVTQQPLMSEAVRIVGEKLDPQKRAEFYHEMINYLLAYHEWLYAERNPKKNGLIGQIHPWETGLDTTPPWIAEIRKSAMPKWIKFLEITKLEKIGGMLRMDKKYVRRSERTTNVEALALHNIRKHLRAKNYSYDNILLDCDLAIADLTFNSILIKSNVALIEIAGFIDFPLDNKLLNNIKDTNNAFSNFWDSESGQYFSINLKNQQLIKEPTVATFLPLYTGIISKEHAAKLVDLLKTEDLYNVNYPIPSVPINSKWFDSKRYWQGPTWVNMNWFVINGLLNYGYREEAEILKSKTIDMVKRSGFHEYFDPNSGLGFGVNNFSWTAALTIDLLGTQLNPLNH